MAQEPVRYRARSAGSVNQSTVMARPCQRVRVGPQPVAASRRRRSANRRSTSQPAGPESVVVGLDLDLATHDLGDGAGQLADRDLASRTGAERTTEHPVGGDRRGEYADQGLLLGLDSNAEDAAPPAGAPPPRPPHRCPALREARTRYV